VHTKATPYWVVPDGNCTTSCPPLDDAVVQLPAPIFSAKATGVGAANVMVTELGTGVGVGPGVVIPLPPQPVEMINKLESTMTIHEDCAIAIWDFLCDRPNIDLLP
jgi:hypothetical protein